MLLFGMAMNTAAVLELPGKGNFAPNKFGSRFGDFLKTQIPGQSKPLWIYEGKLYGTQKQEDIDAFNEMCAKVVPHCHKIMKMQVTPRLLVLPSAPKKKVAKKKGGIKRKTTKGEKPETTEQPKEEAKTPTPPALATPPSGG